MFVTKVTLFQILIEWPNEVRLSAYFKFKKIGAVHMHTCTLSVWKNANNFGHIKNLVFFVILKPFLFENEKKIKALIPVGLDVRQLFYFIHMVWGVQWISVTFLAIFFLQNCQNNNSLQVKNLFSFWTKIIKK